MKMFEIKNKESLESVDEKNFSLERDMQSVTEKNVEKIFGLKFISTEFQLNGLRIDTLAFDEETKSFIIIEYKKGRSFSVIDQGYAYLALLLNNKADFILEFNEKDNKSLKRGDIDWSQSKVLFLANSFTIHQQNAINFKDLPIELWEVRKYKNNNLIYNQIKADENNESINTITKDENVKKIVKEVKKYSADYHFKKGWNNTKEIWEELREKIIELDPRIEEKFNKSYIGYKIDKNNVCNIHTFQSKVNLELCRVEKKDLKDIENKVKNTNWKRYRLGKHSIFILKNKKDINYAIFLIKQVYEKFYKN